MNNGDEIAAATGGIVVSVIGTITFGAITEVVVMAFIGGLAGVIAKRFGEWMLTIIKQKFKIK